jgi:CTP synthase (UTP-ammonia lyase)
MVHIGVIGDYASNNDTHVATSVALQHAADQLDLAIDISWVGTDQITDQATTMLLPFDGLVIAPGSPYRSLSGALAAIQHAREHGVPLLGTCGGFQHVVLEFARNVVGFSDAQHAEYDPYASTLFITPLSCSLVGQTMTVHIKEDTVAAVAYQSTTASERYYCNFGLNPAYLDTIIEAGLSLSGTDTSGEPRILELPSHPFFVATLFVPQTSSKPGMPHPLLIALLAAATTKRSADNTSTSDLV